METIGPNRPSAEDITVKIASEDAQRAICMTIEELIIRLKNKDFYSPPDFDSDYVSVGRNSVIHKDDYIAALEDLKFKIQSEGNWVE